MNAHIIHQKHATRCNVFCDIKNFSMGSPAIFSSLQVYKNKTTHHTIIQKVNGPHGTRSCFHLKIPKLQELANFFSNTKLRLFSEITIIFFVEERTTTTPNSVRKKENSPGTQ